jgi:LDH2 family malate/lactate/ureidoglycolate dehydrogenase
MAEDFGSHMNESFQTLRLSPPVPKTQQVLAAADIDQQNGAKNWEFGVPLLPSLIDQLVTLGAELNVTFLDAKTMRVLAETHS